MSTVKPVSNPSFEAVNQSYPKQVVEKNQQETSKKISRHFSGKTLAFASAATALTAAAITGIVISRRGNRALDALRRESANLSREFENLARRNEELTTANGRLNGTIAELRELLDKAGTSEDVRVVEERLETRLRGAHLNYDTTATPVTGQKVWNPTANTSSYPTSASTTLRSSARSLHIPEISSEGHFEFQVPTSDEMRIVHAPRANFTTARNVQTGISENYADAVVWSDDKISRDILQNFFDGHGQTLDGVKIKFEPVGGGRFRVRIEGKSTYTPDKAAYIGESTKRNNANAAGNYGEGLKMATLKLLKDKGCSRVKIGSDDWALTYKLEKGNLSDARVLSYDLDRVPSLDGNYLEFETGDRSLLESLRKSINRFYHSSNTDFALPQFENSHFGVKVLPKGQKGGLYIAGQKFEFNGDFEGLNSVIYLKEKPPVTVLDPSRDRTSINDSQLEEIAKWLASKCTTRQEKLTLIKALESYGEYLPLGDTPTPMHKFAKKFISSCYYHSSDLNGGINFPENFIAYSHATPDVVRELRMKGYRIFDDAYSSVGMRTIHDFYGDARKHTAIIPNEAQERRILILKEALKKLAPKLEGSHFTSSELDAKIYLFDAAGRSESSIYDSTLAEAITEKGVSKGFWLDRTYLTNGDFAEVLETALHELCHKAGGDMSSEFSYKLTDVNAEAIKQMLENPSVQNELIALRNLWNKTTCAV